MKEQRNEWRLDDTGALDDVVVDDVATFRLERMSEDHVWGAVYRRDGSRTSFDLHGERLSLNFEHDIPAGAQPPADSPPPRLTRYTIAAVSKKGENFYALLADARGDCTWFPCETAIYLASEADDFQAHPVAGADFSRSERPESGAASREIVLKHRRQIELSPGVGADVQRYALAVCEDILNELEAGALRSTPAQTSTWCINQALGDCGAASQVRAV